MLLRTPFSHFPYQVDGASIAASYLRAVSVGTSRLVTLPLFGCTRQRWFNLLLLRSLQHSCSGHRLDSSYWALATSLVVPFRTTLPSPVHNINTTSSLPPPHDATDESWTDINFRDIPGFYARSCIMTGRPLTEPAFHFEPYSYTHHLLSQRILSSASFTPMP